MQKVQKRVINLFLILLIFSCNTQNKDDDYLLLNKVIEQTKIKDIALYKLNEDKNTNIEPLKRYYNYKYNGNPIFNMIKGYDEEKDSLIYDKKSSKELSKTWELQYSILDKTFSKEDIKFILKQIQKSKWDTTKLDNNVQVIKKVERNEKTRKTIYYGGNSISEPLFSIDKKHAIIQHYSPKTFTTLFVFKRDEKDWLEIGNIKNIW